MFPSWLTPKASKEAAIPSGTQQHAVLGTRLNDPLTTDQEDALFACGCFWGAEKGFWKLPGIITTAVGYAGGHQEQPTYQEVCSGRSGHTEIVRVVWNKSVIDYSDLLKLFWECHDPTQGNRQGNDRGSQYRSAIYTTTIQQIELAQASRDSFQQLLSKAGFGAITTEIKADQQFHYAESYHQQYLAKPGSRPYCSAMPTQVALNDFPGANFKLPVSVWQEYDWSVSHCVLRSGNEKIKL
ncbi:Peptide methionine sulfoxide reductase [Prochlorococcus marinus str. MIT 9313]|uniref:Peptide methionine sulfoxide reductase MsrA n=1 Tax=Prochlorococcus marinus (strain MIT 9313) TaxID=74547 RepID=Q7V876_PROMM|nr:peptide-methionine (S)-S-oxide reductase MsrA [Prochlorococcus marinus]CAE20667.1 Peptide methionine sulfoxide reductase [Prochlorococcus marinus str. MIT 9313]